MPPTADARRGRILKSGYRKNRIVSGIHVVRKPLANGVDRWNVYAWRGGPCIHRQDGPRPAITPALLDLAAQARRAGGRGGRTLDYVIDSYRASPEFKALRDSTQRDYRLWLDRISERFGTAPIGAFADSRMREHVILWRNRWADQPRTADKASVMMATLLGWAVANGILAVNVAAGIRTLHRADRSDQVWEERHWEALAEGPAHLIDALRLASLTGLRLGDLVRVRIEDVGEKAIILRTRKRGGRAIVPIVPELRALLDRLTGNRDSGTILVNSRGSAWTESGLGSVFQKSKPDGFDRRIHDLRGTYVTWLATKGMTDDEIARIVGWTAKRVAEIRARYVDEARVIVSLVDRLSA